jgi:cell division protein FtsI/penicillin-binding protein 2
LIRGDSQRPEWTLPGSAAHWSAIRQAIYNVVNDPQGTAYKYAHFEDDGYALCGKTGSATAHSWPTAFQIPYVDALGSKSVATIRAGAKGPACRRFDELYPDAAYDPSKVTVAATWPRDATPESDYSHAWFAGFLQRIDEQRKPVWHESPRVAFAILVEFGGSGGHTSGPIAREVAGVLLDTLGRDLRPDP